MIDFYLDDAREQERAQILQLIEKKTEPASVECDAFSNGLEYPFVITLV